MEQGSRVEVGRPYRLNERGACRVCGSATHRGDYVEGGKTPWCHDASGLPACKPEAVAPAPAVLTSKG